MTTRHHNDHPDVGRLQEFFDGDLSDRERLAVDRHVEGCARCRSELEAWQELATRMAQLGRMRPHEGFAERVMSSVQVPARVSVGARLSAWARGLIQPPSRRHLDTEVFQELVEGLLSGPRAARARAHLDRCGACAREADAWSRTLNALDRLPHLAPKDGFGDRVMARVRVPSAAPESVAVRSGIRWTLPSSWLAAARRMVPRSQRAWAALSGAAVTPAVTLALVAYTVFSSSALTPTALVSYATWQVGDLLRAAWSGGVSLLVEGVTAIGGPGWLTTVDASPLAWVAVGGAYCVSVLFASRVLYRNLVSASTPGIDHA